VKAGIFHPSTMRKQVDHWIEYLRILDAKANKTRNKEIANIMFTKLSNEYPDLQGNDRVRKSLKRAEFLRNKGYREIAMTF